MHTFSLFWNIVTVLVLTYLTGISVLSIVFDCLQFIVAGIVASGEASHSGKYTVKVRFNSSFYTYVLIFSLSGWIIWAVLL